MGALLLGLVLSAQAGPGGYRHLPAGPPQAIAMLNNEAVTDFSDGLIAQTRLVAEAGWLFTFGVDLPYLAYIDEEPEHGVGGAHLSFWLNPLHLRRYPLHEDEDIDLIGLAFGVERTFAEELQQRLGFWAATPIEGVAYSRGMFALRLTFARDQQRAVMVYGAFGGTSSVAGDSLSGQATVTVQQGINERWGIVAELDRTNMVLIRSSALSLLARRELDGGFDLSAGVNLPLNDELTRSAQILVQIRASTQDFRVHANPMDR